MIVFIEGTIEEAAPLSAVIAVQGIGYRVHIPVTTAEKLPSRGEKVRLHTLAVYREDSQALYGFMEREERDFFQLLTEKVSGVGPKIALNILSRLSLEMLRSAIVSGDAALLSKCQGIGRKTAERLCIELKDHMPRGLVSTAGDSGGGGSAGVVSGAVHSQVRDAVAALMQLGYKLDLADKAVGKAVQKLGNEATTEALIKEALK
jgi:Holliday junction DNA helicase RuvA